MSFETQRAADAEFIFSRANSEFGLTLQFWDSDLDPAEDDPSWPLAGEPAPRGKHFAQANDRREDDLGQGELRRVCVQVTKQAVPSFDPQGWMSVNGAVYVIESVHDADLITWVVRGSRDVPTQLGNSARLHGG